jgi:transcriptional regulator with XRE-family HTH domain
MLGASRAPARRAFEEVVVVTSRLQVARADRGWSQTQLIAALVCRAREEGVALPARQSLKAMVSRWENGKARPDVLYARLLRQVYGLGDADLGLADLPVQPRVETRLVKCSV